MKPTENPGPVDGQTEVKETAELHANHTPSGAESQGPDAPMALKASSPPPTTGAPFTAPVPPSHPLPDDSAKVGSSGTKAPTPGAGQEIDYHGLRVITGTTYNLERQVSVGNSIDHDIQRAVSVRKALEFAKSLAALNHLKVAREACEDMVESLLDCAQDYSETGQVRLQKDDRAFMRGGENKIAYKVWNELPGGITKVLQKFSVALRTPDAWEDAELIERLRKELYKFAWRTAKRLHLPAWLWSGTFGVRDGGGLLDPSGLMCLDFDHLGDVSATIARLRADHLVFCVLRSPGGDGAKILIRIPDAAAKNPKFFLRCYQALEKYFAEVYPEAQLSMDKHAKDVPRLCYFTHDPDLVWRADSFILAIEPEAVPQKTKPGESAAAPERKDTKRKFGESKNKHTFEGYDGPSQWEVVRSATDALMNNLAKVPSGTGERNAFWTTLGYAYGSWFSELDDTAIQEEADAYLIGLAESLYGGGSQPVRNAIDNSDGRIGLGSLFKLAHDLAGWKFPWVNEIPTDALLLPGGSVTIKESAQAIFERIAPSNTMFSRGDAIAEIVRDDEGIPRLKLVTPEGFRSRVETFGTIMAWRVNKEGEAKLKQAIMPRDCASAIMASAEAHAILPPINGIMRCPLLIELDGKPTILRNGYHRCLGGVFVECGEEPPQMSLEEAKTVLSHVIEDFDFQASGDKSRAMAAMLTPALRLGGWLRDSVPIDVSEANESQAGKGYRHKLVCAIYNEKPNYVARTEGGVGSVDERLAETLAEGKPFVTYDNVRGLVDSQYLESLLTSNGPFPARVPHHGSMTVDSRHFLIQLSSNGAAMTRDLANRCAISRIRKRQRGFCYWDILGAVLSDYSLFLGAVFRVIQEWVARGKPRSTEARHDFREWCQTLDWIVQNLLGCAPLMEDHDEAQDRVGDPSKVWLRDVMLLLERRGQIGEPVTAMKIVQLCEEHSLAIPGLKSDREDMAARVVGRVLSRVFGTEEVIKMEGFELERITDKDDACRGFNSYVLTRADANSAKVEARNEVDAP